jgi:hypothetical protein
MIIDKKILKYTSCLFLIPSFYSFKYKLYNHSMVSFVSALISFNYWNNNNEFNLHIDLIFSRFCFFYYFYTGTKSLSNILQYESVIAYPLTFFMLYNYNQSCYLHLYCNPYWTYNHIIFHISTLFSQINVINAIKKYI